MCGVLVSSAVYSGQARKAHPTKVAANYPTSQEKPKNSSKESKLVTRVSSKSMEEKQKVMEQFKNHELDILVSTTVIEVGVNVPNATFMIIVDAHRFVL